MMSDKTKYYCNTNISDYILYKTIENHGQLQFTLEIPNTLLNIVDLSVRRHAYSNHSVFELSYYKKYGNNILKPIGIVIKRHNGLGIYSTIISTISQISTIHMQIDEWIVQIIINRDDFPNYKHSPDILSAYKEDLIEKYICNID